MLQIQVPANRRSGAQFMCADDSVTARCRAPRKNPEGCRDDTGAVQGDQPVVQKRMPNIKKILETVEIIHAVGQDRCRTSRKLTRYRRRSSCRGEARQTVVQTVPNAQEIQIGMPQRSAVRGRSGGYARCEGRDSDAQDAAKWLLVMEVADSTALRSSARRTERAGARREPCMLNDSSAKVGLEPEGDIETHTDSVHRQDCWCSREGEAPGYNNSCARHDRCSRSRRAEEDACQEWHRRGA